MHLYKEEFEDTKEVINIRKSKDRQHKKSGINADTREGLTVPAPLVATVVLI
jgi:hypothetical protein